MKPDTSIFARMPLMGMLAIEPFEAADWLEVTNEPILYCANVYLCLTQKDIVSAEELGKLEPKHYFCELWYRCDEGKDIYTIDYGEGQGSTTYLHELVVNYLHENFGVNPDDIQVSRYGRDYT